MLNSNDRLYINFIKTSNLTWCSSYAGWYFSDSIRNEPLTWSRNIATAAKNALEKQGLHIILENSTNEVGISVFDCYIYVKFDNEAEESIFLMKAMSEGISISFEEYDAYIKV